MLAIASAESPRSSAAKTNALLSELPEQLRGLPVTALEEVHAALGLLKDAGIAELPNIEELSRKVAAATLSGNKDLTTQNMANCMWCRTPSAWKATDPPKAGVGCELAALTDIEAASKREEAALQWTKRQEELQSSTASGGEITQRKKNAIKRRVSKEFNDAMLAAEAEIEAMAADTWEPRSYGDGPATFFEVMPDTASPPWPPILAPRRGAVQRAKEAAAAAAAASVEAAEAKEAAGRGKRSSSRSVVTVHVGGAGIGMGSSLWSLLMAQQGIALDGASRAPDAAGDASLHFQETSKGCFLARALWVDAPNAPSLEAVQRTAYVTPENVVSKSSPGMGSRTYSYGFRDLDWFQESFRKQVEAVDSLSLILMTHSLCGGVGSGVGATILEHLSNDYRKQIKWSFSHFPGPVPEDDSELTDTKAVYNAALGFQGLVEHTDMTTLVDNAALRRLGSEGLGLSSPTNADLNGLTARAMSAITAPMCAGIGDEAGSRLLNPRDMLTNLVPYPRMHFTVPTIAPVRPKGDTKAPADISEWAWQALTQGPMASVDLLNGKNIAMGLLSRGMHQYASIDRILEWKLRSRCVCVDWCGIPCHIGSHRDQFSRSGAVGVMAHGEAVCFHNNGSIGNLLSVLRSRFDDTFKDRTAVSEYDFEDNLLAASEDLKTIIVDFEEVCTDTKCDLAGEEEEEEE